jgi:hypothetical protein
VSLGYKINLNFAYDRGGGGGIRTHEPLRDGITHLVLTIGVTRTNDSVPRKHDLESCAFDQASLPLHAGEVSVEPYFIVAAEPLKVKFCFCPLECERMVSA